MRSHRYFGPSLFLVSEGLFTLSFTLAKLISGHLQLAQLILLRFAPALVLIPFFWGRKIVFRVASPKLMILRSLLGVASIACLLYSLKYGEFGRASIIYSSGTLWAFFYSIFALKERPHFLSLLALPLSLLGLVLIFKPTLAPLQLPDMVALMGSIFTAMVYVSLRKLRETHNAETIVFCFFMTGLAISIVPCVWHLQAISLPILELGFVTGFTGFIAQLLMTVGYRYCPVSVSSFIKLTSSIAMVGIGILLFGDPLDVWTLSGMGMVFGAIFLVTRFQ